MPALLTESKPITHVVKTAERSGAPLEILPSEQWFVRLLDKKEELKAKSKACDWHPEWMQLRMEQWIDGLNQDWCISRQRYFGVPFPVWYVDTDTAGGSPSDIKLTFAHPSQLPVNPLADLPLGYMGKRTKTEGKYTAEDLISWNDPHGIKNPTIEAIEIATGKEVRILPDTDVMDTWATSSISPQISAHGISSALCADEARFDALYPADLRPQAHEIIRTWAFYTLVKSYLHNASIPWTDLMISGWCLAEDKTKMSKSKGNIVTPVALIEEKGTDAVRYWAATSRLGQDTAFSPDLLKIGKKLVTKLWNATAFAAIHLEKLDAPRSEPATDGAVTETLDRWILSRLKATVQKATDAFAAYEYADALDATNQFFWADFCDNYLELIKKRIYNEDGSFTAPKQQSAIRALYYCLADILRLYAPFVPHVTEELYSHIFPVNYKYARSIHARGQWPEAALYPADAKALTAGNAAVAILEAIRKAKSERNVSIKFPLERVVIHPLTDDARRIDLTGLLRDLEGAGSIAGLAIAEEAGDGAATADGHFTLALHFAAEAQRA
ncbi:MAG: class I tRNA ligase family protein [Alphaproteobacteria bacterium]